MNPSCSLLPSVQLFLLLLLSPLSIQAAVEPVTVQSPSSRAWVGQRVPFSVTLRAAGSFAGTATFDLPQLPGVQLMKIGTPIVGSETLEGQSWITQTHEFALFSQKDGTVQIPAFPVRFAARDGFTGPAQDVYEEVPGWSISIERPPGSESVGFLITTETLDVTEKWDPPPGPAEVGDVFKRTIHQRALDLSGMAFAPASLTAPEGIRVYPGDAETKDDLERGAFTGERTETITYLMTQPGSFTLPAVTYVWWSPVVKQLQSNTLPAAVFEVTPAPSVLQEMKEEEIHIRWLISVALFLALGIGMWKRKVFKECGYRIWRQLNPPHRVAARKLHRACRRHEAAKAQQAWQEWRATQPANFEPNPSLEDAILDLHRHLFGTLSASDWQGDMLARACRSTLAMNPKRMKPPAPQDLPLINP